MIKLIKRIIPRRYKQVIRNIIKFFKYRYRKIIFSQSLKKNDNLKIIVGAAETYQKGWYSTNEQWLDITNQSHWHNLFNHKQCLTHVVAEHVFEHLTYKEALASLKLIYKHLKPNGMVRIAVPDGYHPDPTYLKHVGICGIGDDAEDHKQLLNIDILIDILKQSSFIPQLIEGYDSQGNLILNEFSNQDGYIMRSRKNQTSSMIKRWNFTDADTSLIVDGIKR